MEQNRSQQMTGVKLASALMLLFGAFNFVSCLIALIGLASGVNSIGGTPGQVALVVVLCIIGAAQIVAAVLGFLSTKAGAANTYRATCRTLGFLLLGVTVAYLVSTAIMRGFAVSTLYNIVVSIVYLTMIK